ncbi:unnamed protein product [Moneuplotes crassus]|uniref:Uncharacterized protein n=1 Tax=Euplotes crassus TaxID=5936 RepID=A0AAD2DCP4_EUPCR|nr:unnamed protein product [Moneuplotes crassus]
MCNAHLTWIHCLFLKGYPDIVVKCLSLVTMLPGIGIAVGTPPPSTIPAGALCILTCCVVWNLGLSVGSFICCVMSGLGHASFSSANFCTAPAISFLLSSGVSSSLIREMHLPVGTPSFSPGRCVSWACFASEHSSMVACVSRELFRSITRLTNSFKCSLAFWSALTFRLLLGSSPDSFRSVGPLRRSLRSDALLGLFLSESLVVRACARWLDSGLSLSLRGESEKVLLLLLLAGVSRSLSSRSDSVDKFSSGRQCLLLRFLRALSCSFKSFHTAL